MADRPILFSAPMVRALLDGRKTQTRRLLKPWPGQQADWLTMDVLHRAPTCYLATVEGQLGAQMQHPHAGKRIDGVDVDPMSPLTWVRLPYVPGDRLWVREASSTWEGSYRDVVYRADVSGQEWSNLSVDARNGAPWKRRPSIHMPRWASRITLIVTDVRIQRLQDISGTDCRAEGVIHNNAIDPKAPSPLWTVPGTEFGGRHPQEPFRALWNSLHGADAWAENPWVVALSFAVHRSNIDQMEAA